MMMDEHGPHTIPKTPTPNLHNAHTYLEVLPLLPVARVPLGVGVVGPVREDAARAVDLRDARVLVCVFVS